MSPVDQTLYTVNLIVALLCGVSWMVTGAGFPLVRAASHRFWLANALFGVGVALLMQRTPEPRYMFYQGVEWSVLGGMVLFHNGLVHLVGRSSEVPWFKSAMPWIVAVLLTSVLHPDPSTFVQRATVFSAALVWLACLCVRACYRGLLGSDFPVGTRVAICIPFGLLAVVMALRVLLVWHEGPPPLSSTGFNPVPRFTGFLWFLTVYVLAINIAMACLMAGRIMTRLSRLAERDHLTGCLNRRSMERRVEVEVQRSRREGGPLACLFFDLDHFKDLNDRYGHAAGDAALQQCARLTQAQLRSSDVLGRFGGEEFVVLMPATTLADAHEVAKRICETLPRSPLAFAGRSISWSASFGVAQLLPNEPGESLVRRADAAMYQAKAQGRNRVQTCVGLVPMPMPVPVV